MKRRKTASKVQDLERSLRRRGGKVKTIYEKNNDEEIRALIEEKINYIWNYIIHIDDIVSEEEFAKVDMKQKMEKKQTLRKTDHTEEIIYYNKNMDNFINVQKVRKALHHFKIQVNVDDIFYMFLYFTNNKYFEKNIKNDIYFSDHIDKKKENIKFHSINVDNLYINYDMFRQIFLNIDLNIESNGQIW
ncbi:conserved Plasmodium protein, unknown function [Plasmodium knowlesi strain H]|uniref:Uncharacterized protein n=3 Tax=Plasmodium knowlesi TaxID=5850 RepID=A0A5K1VUX6_PLAKH|nr:conserved Plasmodium protein, unknown function [Plasmodium knowlesi strain H]OTN65056.1 Uncharacterized protein PKNOH_S120127500 [Plasmodium knowlesi]CAA9988138.1 conserved Plasmodium protein, unknown function [Plasmodium knowlesi strain H]SBO20029.1 conserved Plasmodium protein, unknown function [Plasmodium knowlesi strain H]SBO20799.1 conserved Plasmodium protein, unknown function [Plasmodium knowlesi strain H]VVS77612.1 conserved Plasmodium protein, unknown function [Plasmodium knowlesi |eukprot:XP_002259114.1 hypothetical protein, conserved in Plasmodium species [Plasmodium knowlesi strain H]